MKLGILRDPFLVKVTNQQNLEISTLNSVEHLHHVTYWDKQHFLVSCSVGVWHLPLVLTLPEGLDLQLQAERMKYTAKHISLLINATLYCVMFPMQMLLAIMSGKSCVSPHLMGVM